MQVSEVVIQFDKDEPMNIGVKGENEITLTIDGVHINKTVNQMLI
jgi:hypothetical protein